MFGLHSTCNVSSDIKEKSGYKVWICSHSIQRIYAKSAFFKEFKIKIRHDNMYTWNLQFYIITASTVTCVSLS